MTQAASATLGQGEHSPACPKHTVTIPADLRTPFLGPGPAVLTLGVAVTERGGAHVAQPDGAFAAAVHKGVAVVRVELSGSDHLCQLLHVGRLDVHDVWQDESRLLAPAADLSTPAFSIPLHKPCNPHRAALLCSVSAPRLHGADAAKHALQPLLPPGIHPLHADVPAGLTPWGCCLPTPQLVSTPSPKPVLRAPSPCPQPQSEHWAHGKSCSFPLSACMETAALALHSWEVLTVLSVWTGTRLDPDEFTPARINSLYCSVWAKRKTPLKATEGRKIKPR